MFGKKSTPKEELKPTTSIMLEDNNMDEELDEEVSEEATKEPVEEPLEQLKEETEPKRIVDNLLIAGELTAEGSYRYVLISSKPFRLGEVKVEEV